jgi:hypothetical protein
MAAVAALGLGLASQARAVPITYQLQVFGGPASGSLGGVPFTNANVTFTFDGDTADVIAFSIPGADGYEILKGTATVSIFENSVQILGATFLPAAGVYVSVDGTNSGLGFGSFGVLPSDPTFPGEPVYPGAAYTGTGAVATYDLASDISLFGYPVSCVGFATPAACAAPRALPTTAGDLLIEPFASSAAYFTARTHAVTATPFSAFKVEADLEGRPPSRFELEGRLTLGAASNGIDPVGETVTLQIGSYTASIPPGSFTKTPRGRFVFAGEIDGVHLKARLVPRSGGTYAFRFHGRGAPLAGIADPVSVGLSIGDDTGTATAETGHCD